MQSGFLVFVLAWQTQLAGDGRVLLGGRRCDDRGPSERVIGRSPNDISLFVRGLNGRAQVVMVVVPVDHLAAAVGGLHKQRTGGELAVWPRAVLAADFWRSHLLNATVSSELNLLPCFGNQAFVAVEVVGSCRLRQRSATLVAELIFPDAPVHGVVAVARHQVFAATDLMRHFRQPVLAVVPIQNRPLSLCLLAQVAVGIPFVANHPSGRARAAADLDQSVVAVVLPFT